MMNIEERVIRSKNSEKIEFAAIGCLDDTDPLVIIKTEGKIIAEPIWTIAGDHEGGVYRDYIAQNPGGMHIFIYVHT
jgi:hypothetical protein